MAARMPMTTMTIRSSTIVKPACLGLLTVLLVRVSLVVSFDGRLSPALALEGV